MPNVELTFLATTSSLATDLTAAGGDGIGEGALAMSDMMTILKLNRGCAVLKMVYDGEEQTLELYSPCRGRSQLVVLARPVLPALALGWRAGEVRAAKLPRVNCKNQLF